MSGTDLAVIERRMATARIALGIPTAAEIGDLNTKTPQELAEISYSLSAQLAAVSNRLAELEQPVNDIIKDCRKRVIDTIHENNGRALPHDTFEVLLTPTPGKRSGAEARFAGGLFLLIGIVPAEELVRCLWIESISVKDVTPEAIEAIINAGGKASWKCDLRALDGLAKKYGGEIASIIAEATPRGPDGPEILTIAPKESAMKRVNQS
jgi:hypothetical protein